MTAEPSNLALPRSKSLWIAGALIAATAALRLALRDLPNFAPIAAAALFAGYLLPTRRLAICVPLLAMGLSDFFIGGYAATWRSGLLMATVYSALAAPVLLRGWLRRALPMRREAAGLALPGLIGCGMAASVFFFLTTNLAVWALYDMYELTWSGLGRCYLQALPFFRATLLGDLGFSAALFGGYAFAIRCNLAPSVAIECQ